MDGLKITSSLYPNASVLDEAVAYPSSTSAGVDVQADHRVECAGERLETGREVGGVSDRAPYAPVCGLNVAHVCGSARNANSYREGPALEV
jgi:hypothetical protein